MRVEKDFEKLLKLLNKNKVKYCIVGAFALAFYRRPRYTKDLDIFVEPSIQNGTKIIKTLHEFGFSFSNLRRYGRIERRVLTENKRSILLG